MSKRVYVPYSLLDAWTSDDEITWEDAYKEAVRRAEEKGFYDYVNDVEVEVFDA